MEDCLLMELHEAIRRRAMARSFADEPIEPEVLERILLDALRSPTAGNTAGTAWVVLEGHEQTSAYFDATTDTAWRASPDAYVARYAEADKAASGLGAAPDRWPVPYWFGDAAFGVMAVLLGAVDAGLGACVLGAFRGEEQLARRLGVPAGWRLFCAVALGHPDGRDRRSASLDRPVAPQAERLHRGRW